MKTAIEYELAKRMRSATRWVEGQQGMLFDEGDGAVDGFGRAMLVRTGALPTPYTGAEGVTGTTIDQQPTGANVAGVAVLIKDLNGGKLAANTTYSARLGGFLTGKALYFVEAVAETIGVLDAVVSKSNGKLYFRGNPTPYEPFGTNLWSTSEARAYTLFGDLFVRASYPGPIAGSVAKVHYMSTMFGILSGVHPTGDGTAVTSIYGGASDPLGLAIWQYIGQPLSALCVQISGAPGTNNDTGSGLGPWPPGTKVVVNIRDRIQPTSTTLGAPLGSPLGG